MMKKLLVIFGLESTAIEIKETAKLYLTDYHVIKIFYAPDFVETSIEIQKAIKTNIKISYIISFTNYDMRKKCESHVDTLFSFEPKSIIHPNAYIASSAIVDLGCYIAAHSVISANATLAKHVMINYNVTVGHDARLSEHVSLFPGARVSGNVTIGEGTIIGANSFIFQNLSVGCYNIIDALTAIHANLEDNMISAARVTRSFKQIKK
jgi:UDP-3-O-[3-hydroxymyristoyl] glucosamine N-acyltransferase